MYDIPTNTGLIDSLTIYLPIKDIEVINKKLVSDFVPYYPDLDKDNTDLHECYSDEIYPPKPIPIQLNGINFRFNRVVFPPNKENKEGLELIRLTLTTKMLRERYFQGINHDNLQIIIDYVNSFNIIKFDIKTALNSQCNDIDICINYRLQFNSYQESMYFLRKKVIPSKSHKVSIYPRKKTYDKDENFGLMFGDRDSGTVSTPFVKFYNKTNELLTNSTDFYNTYLFPQAKYGIDFNNIIRKEITIKNSAFKRSLHKKKLLPFGNTLKTLKDVLDLTTHELTKICNVQLKYYFSKREIHISDDLSPIEKALSYYQARLIELGEDKVSLLAPLTLFDTKNKSEKVAKTRLKTKLEHVMNRTLDTNYLDDLLTRNSIANEFIRLQEIW